MGEYRRVELDHNNTIYRSMHCVYLLNMDRRDTLCVATWRRSSQNNPQIGELVLCVEYVQRRSMHSVYVRIVDAGWRRLCGVYIQGVWNSGRRRVMGDTRLNTRLLVCTSGDHQTRTRCVAPRAARCCVGAKQGHCPCSV